MKEYDLNLNEDNKLLLRKSSDFESSPHEIKSEFKLNENLINKSEFSSFQDLEKIKLLIKKMNYCEISNYDKFILICKINNILKKENYNNKFILLETFINLGIEKNILLKRKKIMSNVQNTLTDSRKVSGD